MRKRKKETYLSKETNKTIHLSIIILYIYIYIYLFFFWQGHCLEYRWNRNRMERTFDCKWKDFDAHPSDIRSGDFTDQRGELITVTVNLSTRNPARVKSDKKTRKVFTSFMISRLSSLKITLQILRRYMHNRLNQWHRTADRYTSYSSLWSCKAAVVNDLINIKIRPM